jgi:hypothetical protein
MSRLKIIKHTMSVEYECPETKTKHATKIDNPQIIHGKHFEDWEYECIFVKCHACGKEHRFEI